MDANRRGFGNLGMTPTSDEDANQTANRYKWWEVLGIPVLWPFMWMWNY
jgi:hypothetical protein